MENTWSTMQCLLSALLLIASVHSQSPGFLLEPDDASVIGGSAVFLRCHVENAAGSVQWTRDGFAMGTDRALPGYPRYEIHGAVELGEYDLFIANAQLEDDAVFQCQIGATADAPGLVSKQATLTVLLPPGQPTIDSATEQSINLGSLEVTEGVAYNVTCHANGGKPAPEITWLRNGEAVTGGVTYEKVAREGDKREDAIGRLQITPTKDDHLAHYECRASNAALTSPKFARVELKVLYSPEVVLRVDPERKIREGGSVTFTCEAEANPNEVTYSWIVGGATIDGATEPTYVMNDVTRDQNTNEVTCQATNPVGMKSVTHTLNVEYAPYFTTEPVPVAAEPGDDVTLNCDVTGNPIPSITWTRGNSELSRASSLQLAEVELRDFGVYRCTASSIGFRNVYRDVHLLKNGPPKITSSRKQSARVGETAAIECKAVSVPEPTSITWSKGSDVINMDEQKRYSVREEEAVHGRKSILEIRSSQDKDFGEFNCTVVNSYGSTTAIIQFTKEEVVSLTYILLGVLLSVAFIIVTLIIVYVLYRRRRTDSEYGSDSSENTLHQKTKDKNPDDGKSEVTHISPGGSSSGGGGGPVDEWAKSTVENMYERNMMRGYGGGGAGPYDETIGNNKPYNYDLTDGFGNQGYNAQQNNNPYSTFPRPVNPYTNTRYAASDYGGPTSNYSDAGTFGRSRTPQPHYSHRIAPQHRPHYATSDYGGGATLPRGVGGGGSHMGGHAPVNLDSRLATNV